MKRSGSNHLTQMWPKEMDNIDNKLRNLNSRGKNKKAIQTKANKKEKKSVLFLRISVHFLISWFFKYLQRVHRQNRHET